MIPKYGYIFTPPDTSWGKDWKSRLTTSKVLRQWKGSKRPKAETSQEYTRRRIKEATKQDKIDKALNTTANVLHKIGVGATTTGLAGSLILAPAATVGAVAGGTAGSKLTDIATQIITRDNQTTWAKELNRKLGLRDNSMIGEILHPGMLIGGTVGARIAPTVVGWYKPIKSFSKNFIHPSEVVNEGYVNPSIRYVDITTQEPLATKPLRETSPIIIEQSPVKQSLTQLAEYNSPAIEVKPIRQQVGNGRERIDINNLENQIRSRLGRGINDLGPVEEETILGYAEDLRPYYEAGNKAGGEANSYEWDYVRNNINRKANLDNRTKEGLITRDLSKGENPYELEDLVENGHLKNNTALEETYSGTRGDENFFDRSDDAHTRASKYLRTKYGIKDRNSLGNVGEDNPKNRSGVIMTSDGWQYSIDSFGPALKHLYRALKSGRRFKLLDTNKTHVRANDYGQLNRYTEHYNPEFTDIFINSKGNLPEGVKAVRVKDKIFFQNKDGRIMGSIRERTPEQIINERLPNSNQKAPNEWIKQINDEFKLNIPLARVNQKGQIEWPNLYGILYKRGGRL